MLSLVVGSKQPIIAPSILAADVTRLGEEVELVTNAGADWLHIDVMDGHFVPNLTFGPNVVRGLRRISKLPLDVHLMIEKPGLVIDDYVKAGADYLTVHTEAVVHLDRTLDAIRQAGAKAGVSLNPSTPPETLEFVMDKADLILVMSVNPGFGGQSFLPTSLAKIARLRDMIEKSGRDIRLEVDGGVGSKNVSKILAAGADVLVAGSAIFGHNSYAEAIQGLRL